MLLAICDNPDILSAMLIINNVIKIIKIVIPAILIITSTISFFKATIDSDNLKNAVNLFIVKICVAAMIFMIPSIINAVISLLPVQTDYKSCFTNATKENINKLLLKNAQDLVKSVEGSLLLSEYHDALYAVNRLKDGTTKTNLLNRLLSVKSAIDDGARKKINAYYSKLEEGNKSSESYGKASSGASLDASGLQSSLGNGKCQAGVPQKSEPDPSAFISCWSEHLRMSDFIFPKDKSTGLPLGTWPVNYESIPTQLTSYKIYNREFIFPVTPEKETYHFVYNHLGMDIMSKVGYPVYSPVDGTLVYSEWGHTVNNGGDESAYTASIRMNNPVTINGKKIQNIFLTHMSGIRYRCSSNRCNRTVKKGELLGFVGSAAGSNTSVGFAPHLHITMYPTSYNDGLYTPETESVFNIPNKTSSYKIKAGG